MSRFGASSCLEGPFVHYSESLVFPRVDWTVCTLPPCAIRSDSYRVIIFNEMRTRDSEQESQHIPQTIGFASSRSDRLHTAQS